MKYGKLISIRKVLSHLMKYGKLISMGKLLSHLFPLKPPTKHEAFFTFSLITLSPLLFLQTKGVPRGESKTPK